MSNEEDFGTDIITDASRALRVLVPSGQATIGRLAKELSLTPRTLQRKLQKGRSSFSELLAAVRVELAREGLANGLTITQLAAVLGYSESSAVSRFLRENGLSPRGMRAIRAVGNQAIGIERVADAIYDSAASDRWSRVAQVVGSFLEGVHIRIWVMEPKTNEVMFDQLTPGLPSFLPGTYQQHYFATDPAIPPILARPGHAISCAEVGDIADSEKSALVNDLLDRPGIDVRWRMMEAAPLHSGHLLFFAAGRPRWRGPFQAFETRRHDMVFRKLRRAIDFETRIDTLSKSKSVIEHALDALPSGVLVVSKSLDVLHANKPAIGMIGKGTGLEYAYGKLRGTRMFDHAAIERIVAGAAHGGDEGQGAAIVGTVDGQRIRARAFRVPRTAFVAGGESDCQVALILTTDGVCDTA